jgi:ganglioside-induced differentiation-associated protein 1
MMEPAKLSGARPRLYHAPSSYYSMIARLALAEGGIAHESVFVDIHVRMSQQQPDYVRLNPNMTVPTLVLSDCILDQSRDIAEYALGVSEATLDGETKAWLDLHYAYPIEELTFGGVLARNPVARLVIPRYLEAAHRRLLARAAANPDLAEVYEARAAVFAERVRTLDPAALMRLSERRRTEAIGFMDRLEQALRAGLGTEIPKRPALARYWRAMQARPSFSAADIWTKVHVFRLIGGILGIARG